MKKAMLFRAWPKLYSQGLQSLSHSVYLNQEVYNSLGFT